MNCFGVFFPTFGLPGDPDPGAGEGFVVGALQHLDCEFIIRDSFAWMQKLVLLQCVDTNGKHK